ncbi:MAG TPA: LysM domain-containing protein [Phycisphaerae bacterium]|nr:LysM domain-containing protein [Phycisphaerae bacterium]
MRWSATTLLVTVLLVSLAGCEQPAQKLDMQDVSDQSGTMEPDYYATDPAATTPGDSYAESYPTYPVETASAGSGSGSGLEPTPMPGVSGKTHIVAKGDTLFALARRYYSNEGRWKDIWAANRSAVANPNVIHVGQELVIP